MNPASFNPTAYAAFANGSTPFPFGPGEFTGSGEFTDFGVRFGGGLLTGPDLNALITGDFGLYVRFRLDDGALPLPDPNPNGGKHVLGDRDSAYFGLSLFGGKAPSAHAYLVSGGHVAAAVTRYGWNEAKIALIRGALCLSVNGAPWEIDDSPNLHANAGRISIFGVDAGPSGLLACEISHLGIYPPTSLAAMEQIGL